MRFCPSCEVRLKKSEEGLKCPKCDYVEGKEGSSLTKQKSEQEVSEFNVIDDSEKADTMPTVKIDCEKCGHNQAVWWMLQTRSADEPTTQFYRCTKCNYTWRNYA